jgi:hypothetical protein
LNVEEYEQIGMREPPDTPATSRNRHAAIFSRLPTLGSSDGVNA